MTYNLSFMDNTTSFLTIIEGINTESNGWFSGALLIFLFILIIMVFSDFEFKNVLLADSFICSIVAGLLFASGLLNPVFLGVPIAVFIGTLIMKVWGSS